jgi:amino acid transporter
MSKKYYKNKLSFKETLSSKKWTFFVFTIAVIISAIFYLVNYYNNNFLLKYISENLWLQTIFMFLTVAGLISIFYPFSIRKELNEKDIINNYEEKIRIEKQTEENRKKATF